MAFLAARVMWACPYFTRSLVRKRVRLPSSVSYLQSNCKHNRCHESPVRILGEPFLFMLPPRIPGRESENTQNLRCFATHASAESVGDQANYNGNRGMSSARRGAFRLAGLTRGISSRIRSLESEDWILLLISLGWCGLFASAATFNAWRAATREARHPYLADAKSILQSDRRVVDLLGEPLEVRAVEEHSETFAPWKRLLLQLNGPKGIAKAFVCARRVGYSEEDLIEKILEEDEGPLWSHPYLVKQWILQGVSDLWERFQQLISSDGKGGSSISTGVGQWEVDCLFVLPDATSAADATNSQVLSNVISCKGSPTDSPDWYRLVPSQHSTEKLLTHWIANTCLLFLCLYSIKRLRAEWKMAAERLSCFRFLNHFITHHRQLQQLATRQLQEARRKRNSFPATVSTDNNVVAPQAKVRMRYFTGQLSREAIDGVAHLEIEGGEDARDDPDVTDKLQCELRLQAYRPSPSVPYVALESTLSLIEEPRNAEDPPFPVVQTYALDPKAVHTPPEP